MKVSQAGLIIATHCIIIITYSNVETHTQHRQPVRVIVTALCQRQRVPVTTYNNLTRLFEDVIPLEDVISYKHRVKLYIY